jgi:hypothetical protein
LCAPQVDRLTCFSGRQKQEVFAAASMDGFTAARKTSNDPPPIDRESNVVNEQKVFSWRVSLS